mmetsp:Transcript_17925/g.60025  ORF Transcript_17925/g.60025 Transcript_17925/m.60025 type:complete len:229 (-) Transcript_17925:1000-1686(-)
MPPRHHLGGWARAPRVPHRPRARAGEARGQRRGRRVPRGGAPWKPWGRRGAAERQPGARAQRERHSPLGRRRPGVARHDERPPRPRPRSPRGRRGAGRERHARGGLRAQGLAAAAGHEPPAGGGARRRQPDPGHPPRSDPRGGVPGSAYHRHRNALRWAGADRWRRSGLLHGQRRALRSSRRAPSPRRSGPQRPRGRAAGTGAHLPGARGAHGARPRRDRGRSRAAPP